MNTRLKNTTPRRKTASGEFLETSPDYAYKIDESAISLPRKKQVAGMTGASGRSIWLNRDPIEEEGGMNVYGFVENNGINKLDYLGNLSLPKITLKTGVSGSGTYCFYIPAIPGGAVCGSGSVSVTVGECCKENGKRDTYTNIKANFKFFFRYGVSSKPFSWRVRQPIVQNLTNCPKTKRKHDGGIFFRVTWGFGYGTANYSFASHKWKYTAGFTFSMGSHGRSRDVPDVGAALDGGGWYNYTLIGTGDGGDI